MKVKVVLWQPGGLSWFLKCFTLRTGSLSNDWDNNETMRVVWDALGWLIKGT
jgi:hypothetical protein